MEALLRLLRLPAALMLGPMAAAILLAAGETTIRIPRPFFTFSQTIIGIMVARFLPLSMLHPLLRDWPVLLASTAAVIGSSFVIGWALARLKVLPGSTAIWGAAPGAAAVMVIMSEAFGADLRLVAFMQYLRVVFVAAAATLVARLSLGHAAAAAASPWFPVPGWGLAGTLGLSAAGMASSRLAFLRAGPLLVPMVLGIGLGDAGLLRIELPLWLLTLCYACLGWSIGLRFSREILAHAWRALPRIAGAILLLIALCGVFAWILTLTLHVSPLTAYLATSPGGADSVAVIAASTPNVDVGFVMALQVARFLIVMLLGPSVAKRVARRFS